MNDIFISVEQNGEKLEMRISGDKCGDDFKYVFRSIMHFLTFQPSTIEEIIPSEIGVCSNDEEEASCFKGKNNKD